MPRAVVFNFTRYFTFERGLQVLSLVVRGPQTFEMHIYINGKVVPVPKQHAMKMYGGSGCKVPRILNLGNRWR